MLASLAKCETLWHTVKGKTRKVNKRDLLKYWKPIRIAKLLKKSIIPENNVKNKIESRSNKKKRDGLKTTINNAGNAAVSNQQEAKIAMRSNSNANTENNQERKLERKTNSTVIIGKARITNKRSVHRFNYNSLHCSISNSHTLSVYLKNSSPLYV